MKKSEMKTDPEDVIRPLEGHVGLRNTDELLGVREGLHALCALLRHIQSCQSRAGHGGGGGQKGEVPLLLPNRRWLVCQGLAGEEGISSFASHG